MSSLKGNRLVAQVRGQSWKQALLKGKLQSQQSPTALKLLRVEKGVSQTVLAKEIQMSLASYGNIERGRIGVKRHLALYLADYFSVSIFVFSCVLCPCDLCPDI